MHCLGRHDAVAERGELFRQSEPEGGAGPPPIRQAHQPFHEAGRGPVLPVVAYESG